jgi:phosphatidylserine decarboxylase
MNDPFRLTDTPGRTAFPIARTGLPLVYAGAFVTAVFALLGFTIPTIVCLLGTLFTCYFFRDPDRVVPTEPGALVAPADGKVIRDEVVEIPPHMEGPRRVVSIFMSVFNVHVNRNPVDGTVTKVAYHPGKFFSANLDKASLENEHNAITLRTENGTEICVVQIAGLIARRIICQIQKGDTVIRGQRFGMICFGSRLDIYLPPDTQTDIAIGDRVSAGTSIICRLPPS